MSTTLYVEQENGNLKLVAEVEDIDNAALAVDALLDETKIREREFVAVIGSLEEGQVTRVVVESDEPVNPRRGIVISANFGGGGSTVDDDEPAPKPARRRTSTGRKPAARKPAAKKPAARKPAAKKTAARKPAAKRSTAKKSGGSPFKRNAKGDD